MGGNPNIPSLYFRLPTHCSPDKQREPHAIVDRHRERYQEEGDIGGEELDEVFSLDPRHGQDRREARKGGRAGRGAVDCQERPDGCVACS